MTLDHESLWKKSKQTFAKAFDARAGGREEDFVLYVGLGLEVLGKSHLAKINPLLVVAVDGKNDTSLLIASGAIKGTWKDVRSIGASAVYARCKRIIASFDKQAEDFCCVLADERNGHLHSGAFPFDEKKDDAWQQSCWKAVSVLVEAQGRTLEELVGNEQATYARKVIHDATRHQAEIVAQRIERCRSTFDQLELDEQRLRERMARIRIQRFEHALDVTRTSQMCPACACSGGIDGDVAGWEGLAGGFADCLLNTTHFECDACGLVLGRREDVQHGGLPLTYTKRMSVEYDDSNDYDRWRDDQLTEGH